MDYLIYNLPAAWGACVLFLFFGLTRVLKHPVVMHRTLFLAPTSVFLLIYFLGSSERLMAWWQSFGYSETQGMAAIVAFSLVVGGLIAPALFGRKEQRLLVYGLNKTAFRKILKEELLLCDPSVIRRELDWKSLYFDVEVELGEEGWGNNLSVHFEGAQSRDLVHELLPSLRARLTEEPLSSSSLNGMMLIRVMLIIAAIIGFVVLLASGFRVF